MNNRIIYLDHAATTPLDPQVLERMLPYLTEHYGNPSSIHQAGRAALRGVNEAREIASTILKATSKEIIFTGSGSESNNLAIKGVALAQQQRGKGNHIITSAIEHHSVLHTVEYLQHFGFDVTTLQVNNKGFVHPDHLRAALRADTVLVSIAYANNEIGTIQPISELGSICHEWGIPFHTDAVQIAGLLPPDVDQLNVDLLTLAAHKFYGPRGAGLLYVRRGTPLLPQISGGEQEQQRRAGTENTPAIVGLAAALELAERDRLQYVEHCTSLRDKLIDGILPYIPGTCLNGSRIQRLPNNVNISFDNVDSESILLLLDQYGICASSGSACTSGSLDPSHVLIALGLPRERAAGAVRFTVGKAVTSEDIDQVLDLLPTLVEQLRTMFDS
jgi:cysteine desulfurase